MADRSFLTWPFLDDRHRALKEELDAFAAGLGALAHDDADVDATCRALVRRLADAGLLRLSAELDVRSLCLARETLAYHGGLPDFAFAMQGLGSGAITLFGTDAQKAALIPRVVAGEAITGFALSEPVAGSDVAALATTARLDGDAYVLDGVKTWISNGGIADAYTVFARTGEAAGARGLSAFLVDADTPGLRIANRIDVIAPHPLATLAFEGCRIPADRLIGASGGGFKVAMATLDVFRSTVGAAALGFARRAFDETLAQVSSRELFGAPLAELQLVQGKLADMALEIDSAALLVYRAAWAKDVGGGRITREAAMAKLHATEAAQRVIDAAVQLHGGLGVTSGHPVERLYREIRALRIYEGASEVQQVIIARQALAAHATEEPARVTLADTFAADGLPPRAQWPDLLIEPLGYPERLNCAVTLLDDTVEAGHGDRLAFIAESETLTYTALQEKVDRICRVLVEGLGLVTGNRVLLRAPNTPMMMACWLAVVKAGGIVVATMPLLRRKELQEIIEHAEIHLALCDDRLLDELDGICRRVVPFAELSERALGKPAGFEACDTSADDVVLIAYTSGTSGRPKGTMHFHRDVLAICDTFSREIVRPTRDDVFIGSPPIAFTFGLGGLVTFPMRVGAASVLLEQAAPDKLLEAIERHGATVCFTAPTAYRRMLSLGVDGKIDSLRRCISAGETLPRPVWEAWHEATGLRMIDGIGATEMLHIFISAADDDIRPGATGKPVPGFEARVVDDEMRDVGPGVVGRLAVRGPTGCRYLKDARQADYVRDGWNLTGDAYLMDEDGYFYYQARTDDMIVTGGYNIAGPEVEEALIMHASVLECAVVSAQDADRGAIVKAFVVPVEGVEPGDDLTRELQDFVKATIAPYKYPRAIEYVDALPRTETGKVRRFILRERGV